MPYDPRTAQDIVRSLAARMVARSGFSDLVRGSRVLGMVGAVAEELAGVELRIANVRDSFSLDSVSGSDLDERLRDFPGDFPTRRGSIAAAGSVLTIQRTDTAAPLNVPSGSIVGRSDEGSITYQTQAAAAFIVGQASVTGVAIVCTTPGETGNCVAGQIDKMVSISDEITSVTNTAGLTNGSAQETDDSLRSRGYRHLSSLAQCQPSALESFALNFEADDGSVLSYARAYEDPRNPGYTELVVDDGSGMAGLKRIGLIVTNTTGPVGALTQVWHEAAAVDTPFLTIGGVVQDPADFVSHPEKGLIWLDTPMAAATIWACFSYEVYTGILAELQTGINERRAAGTRVRVVPPTIQGEQFDMVVVPAQGADLSDVQTSALNAAISFTSALGPGDPLYVSQLVAAILIDTTILNVFIREPGSSTHADDRYPVSDRYVLRSTSLDITITTETVS